MYRIAREFLLRLGRTDVGIQTLSNLLRWVLLPIVRHSHCFTIRTTTSRQVYCILAIYLLWILSSSEGKARLDLELTLSQSSRQKARLDRHNSSACSLSSVSSCIADFLFLSSPLPGFPDETMVCTPFEYSGAFQIKLFSFVPLSFSKLVDGLDVHSTGFSNVYSFYFSVLKRIISEKAHERRQKIMKIFLRTHQ